MPTLFQEKKEAKVEQFFFLYDLLTLHHNLYSTDLHLPCSCSKGNRKNSFSSLSLASLVYSECQPSWPSSHWFVPTFAFNLGYGSLDSICGMCILNLSLLQLFPCSHISPCSLFFILGIIPRGYSRILFLKAPSFLHNRPFENHRLWLDSCVFFLPFSERACVWLYQLSFP